MGLYDCYGNCQLKIGPCELDVYDVGDKVPIPDGIYIDYGGLVVIKDGVFIAEFKDLTDKYGSSLDTKEIVEGQNPIAQVVKNMQQDKKQI